jgi:hypothetical protein
MEENMTSSKVLAVAALLALAAAPAVHAACTNATVAGTWGFSTTGTLFLPGPAPVVAAGTITYNLDGTVNGSQDRSVGGLFAHETIQGTYTIDSGCGLRLVANVYDSGGNLVRTSVIDGIVADNGKQTRAMFESVTLEPSGTPLRSALSVEAIRVQGHGQ